jgi:hypothetical protein
MATVGLLGKGGSALILARWMMRGLDRAKVWTNYVCDRVIDHCDTILIDYEKQAPSRFSPTAKWIARHVGEFCWLWRDLPRQWVYDLAGEAWRMRVVGQDSDLTDIAHLFYGRETPKIEKIGRVALWRLAERVPAWLQGEGVQLVISRVAPHSPFRAGGPQSFLLPNRVEQCLDLSVPIEDRLSGRRGRGIRTRINGAERSGFGFRFSQDPADFDRFYNDMYLPFVTSRHGRLASVSTYKQLRTYFGMGGLLVITLDGEPVAGSVCYLNDGVFYGVEEGVLNNDRQLIQSGINAYIYWCSYQWAMQNHARLFNMGPSFPAASDGPFAFKAHWGTRVVRRRRLITYWEVCCGSLTEDQRQRLNDLGCIAECEGAFFRVWLADAGQADDDLPDDDSLVTDNGINGYLLLNAASAQVRSIE